MGLFNRQRLKLIADKRVIKYLVYAIGEITIVIIGIFIAIQLNNWNENRKTITKVERIFKKIDSNLKSNKEKIKPLVEWYVQCDSMIQLVKLNILDYEDYQKNEELLTLVNYYGQVQIEKSGYLKLNDYREDIPPSYDSILPKLELLYGQFVPLTERYALVMENFNHRMHERWASKYNWFSEPRDLSNKKDRIEHFLNSSEYQNDVRLYSMYSKDNYVAGLSAVQKLSENILNELQKLRAYKNGN